MPGRNLRRGQAPALHNFRVRSTDGALALPALGLLRAKNELTKLGKSLVEKVTAKKKGGYLARVKRMRMAYGLICFTAFFEALDRVLPKDLRKKIDLDPAEKKRIAERATRVTDKDRAVADPQREGPQDVPLPFPHPVAQFEEQTQRPTRSYEQMAKGLGEFFKRLPTPEKGNDGPARFAKAAEKLPQIALKCFEAQYVELARKYHDFCVWSQLHEHRTTQGKLKAISEYVSSHAALLAESEKNRHRVHQTSQDRVGHSRSIQGSRSQGCRRRPET